jgi:hypothetical protein
MEVIGGIHAHAALSRGEERNLVVFEWNVGRELEKVWTFLVKEIIPCLCQDSIA